MIGIFAMFLILFKNIKLSFIGVVPNFIAAFFILGHYWSAWYSIRYDDYNYCCNYNWDSC